MGRQPAAFKMCHMGALCWGRCATATRANYCLWGVGVGHIQQTTNTTVAQGQRTSGQLALFMSIMSTVEAFVWIQISTHHLKAGQARCNVPSISSKPHRVSRQSYLTKASNQLPLPHINLSTLSSDQVTHAWSWFGHISVLCVAWPAVQPKAEAEVRFCFRFRAFLCLRLGFRFWRQSGEDVARPLERDIVERFTVTVVAFDFDATVSMRICLLGRGIVFQQLYCVVAVLQ